MHDEATQILIDTLRGELREEKGVVEALEESKADAERMLSAEIGRRCASDSRVERLLDGLKRHEALWGEISEPVRNSTLHGVWQEDRYLYKLAHEIEAEHQNRFAKRACGAPPMPEQEKRWTIYVCPDCGEKQQGIGSVDHRHGDAPRAFAAPLIVVPLSSLEELREGLRREIERLTESIDNCRRNAHDAEAAALSFTRSRLEQLLPTSKEQSGG